MSNISKSHKTKSFVSIPKSGENAIIILFYILILISAFSPLFTCRIIHRMGRSPLLSHRAVARIGGDSLNIIKEDEGVIYTNAHDIFLCNIIMFQHMHSSLHQYHPRLSISLEFVKDASCVSYTTPKGYWLG